MVYVVERWEVEGAEADPGGEERGRAVGLSCRLRFLARAVLPACRPQEELRRALPEG